MTTAQKEQLITGIWRSFTCELVGAITWPILYGLYYFDGIGKKKDPSYDCWALKNSKIPIAGVVELSDDRARNVTESFDIVLGIGFYTTMVNLLILMPLKYFFLS